MKLAPLTRAIEVRAEQVRDRLIELTFSSEAPVQRWFGKEVLDHSEAAAKLDRLNNGAPVLFNHNMDDLRGVVEKAWIGDDKRGHAIIRLANNDDGQKALDLINDNVLRNVSFMYRVLEWAQTEEEERAGTYRVTDWEALEISLVTVPADQSVGIGRALARSFSTDELEVRTVVRASPDVSTKSAQAARGVTMTDNPVTAAAGTSAEVPKISAIDADKERIQAISNLCAAMKIDSRTEETWIREATPFTEVSKELLDVMELRGRQKPLVASTIGLSNRETQQYSLFRAVRALRYGSQNPRFMEEAAFELDCSRTVGKRIGRELTSSILVPAEILQRPLGESARAMATTPGSKGGYLVGIETMGFIDILRNRSVSMNMGARVLSGLQGNVVFPRQTGKASVTWQAGEHVSVTASDQALGQLSMTPKTCIAITDVSEQLLAQSSPSAESFVMADLAADVAIDGVDAAVINGTGGAQPLGIKNTTGITSGQDAATATYAKVLAFPAAAGAVNALRGNRGWVTNTAGAAVLMQKQRFSSTDTPLWEGNLEDGVLVGYRAMSSEQLASGNLIFGSWDEVVIGEWGVLELSTDNGGTRFNTATVGIRAMWMVDVMLRYPQAFVVSTNLSA